MYSCRTFHQPVGGSLRGWFLRPLDASPPLLGIDPRVAAFRATFDTRVERKNKQMNRTREVEQKAKVLTNSY
eukprot:1065810-Prorocentrum_minimum.AAC.3